MPTLPFIKVKIDKENFIWAIVISCSFLLLIVKTYYLYHGFRYISFGIDGPRVLGRVQELLNFGVMDSYASNRYGLPAFAALIVKMFHLPSSQTLAIPFLMINLGAGLLIALLAILWGRKLRAGAVSFLLFSASFLPDTVNDSFFHSLLISPLRILLLWLFLNQSGQVKQIILGIGVFLITTYSNFTYPIQSITLDLFILMIILMEYYRNPFKRKRCAWVLGSQITGLLSYYIFSLYHLDPHTTWNILISRTYTLESAGMDVRSVAIIIAAFIVTQFILIILLLKNKLPGHLPSLSLKLPKLNKIFKIIATICLIAFTFLTFARWLPLSATYSWPVWLKAYINDGTLLSYSLILLFLYVVFTTIHRHFRQPMINVLLYIWVLYVIFFKFIHINSSLNIIKDERFISLVYPFIFIFTGSLLLKTSRNLFVILIFTIITWNMTSWLELVHYPSEAKLSVLPAMDWFNQQSDHQSVIYYASYFNSSRLSFHEKFYSEYFSPSKLAFDDISPMGKCTNTVDECVQGYSDFIQTYHPKYLIIEDDAYDGSYELLSALGTVIYDKDVRIIKL